MVLAAFGIGCKTVRHAQSPTGPHCSILTYNVNWGGPEPNLAAEIIKKSGAEIVCLQETTSAWEGFLRTNVANDYPFMDFRSSPNRMGGGLAFLSKTPMEEIAYVPSNTGWFDGWIRAFETDIGRIQVLNVHLHPQVGERGSWSIGGYLFTGDDRRKEVQRFSEALAPSTPKVVAGDFNDTDHGAPVKWLKKQGFTDALREFDRHSDTWEWHASLIHIRRRLDHIMFSPELSCCSAAVIHAGASDHFPVVATFENKPVEMPHAVAE
jgi:endonuclease/exonuclease/phosphatase (EEP) superfamily protein YafD